jgi:hypothetical protein
VSPAPLRIRRSTVQRGTLKPSRKSCRQILYAPYTPSKLACQTRRILAQSASSPLARAERRSGPLCRACARSTSRAPSAASTRLAACRRHTRTAAPTCAASPQCTPSSRRSSCSLPTPNGAHAAARIPAAPPAPGPSSSTCPVSPWIHPVNSRASEKSEAIQFEYVDT